VKKFVVLFVIFVLIFSGISGLKAVVNSGYMLSMDAQPSVVDIGKSSILTFKLTKNETPVASAEIFLGMMSLKGNLENSVVYTNASGVATTKFISSQASEGFILAKSNIYDGKSVITLESAISISVKDLNKRPESVIDNVNPVPVRLGKPVTMTGHCTDSDGTVVGWEWDFGDGTTQKGEGHSSLVTHVYQKHGNYAVSFVATDNRGAKSDPPRIIVKVVNNNPPIIKNASWPKKVRVLENVQFTITCEDMESRLTEIFVDFGDGTSEKRKTYGLEFTAKFDHTYQKPGIYFPTCYAIDDEGQGPTYPPEPQELIVEGMAKGGLRLIISGSTSDQAEIVGPYPQNNIVFEQHITDDTIATGLVLEPGIYKVRCKDKSKKFKFPSYIIVESGIVTTYIGRIWKPWISADIESSNSQNRLIVKVMDEFGVANISGSLHVFGTGVEGSATVAMTNGLCSLELEDLDKTPELNLILNARFDEVEQIFEFKKRMPTPLPKFELVAVKNIDSVSVYCKPLTNSPLLPVMQVSATVTDKLTGIRVENSEALLLFPEIVKGDKWPLMVTLRPVSRSHDRHIVKLDIRVVADAMTVCESITFDPSLTQLRLINDTAYNASGNAIVSLGLFIQEDNQFKPNQKIFLDYEITDKYGFVDSKKAPVGLPQSLVTGISGKATLEIDLKKALDGIPARSIIIRARVKCDGITYTNTQFVTTILSPPKIIASSTQNGNTHNISIYIEDSDGLPVSGGWVDIFYILSDKELPGKELGVLDNPPQSIRANQGGNAEFLLKAPNGKLLKLLLSATVRGVKILKELIIQ
jgi:hypothetical protein